MDRLIHRCLRVGQKLLVFLIEDVGLYQYLAVFCFVVLFLGWAYAALSPSGNGIGQNSTALNDVTFLNGVYFSVTTISSLGYGDLHPFGLSKAIACCEVLFGLALMGIVIAKVTSRRLSYHVQRLFASDAQKRLEEFANLFDRSEHELSEAMTELGRAYQTTPGEPDKPPEQRAQALSGFALSLAMLHSNAAALSDYMSSETQQSDYFGIVPVDAVVRLGNSIDKGMFVLGQLIISLSAEARTEVLGVQNRQRISDTLDSQRSVCGFVQSHAKNQDLSRCFRRVLETCNSVLDRYFAMPAELAASEQPDQVLEGADEPQEPSRPLAGEEQDLDSEPPTSDPD